MKQMTVDPVCGMQVDSATSKHVFEHEGARYTCPMHPEVMQDGPGDCPKCGMALSSVSVVTNALRLNRVKL